MGLPTGNLSRLLASTSIRLQGGEFQRPWKRGSMIAKWPLEVEIAMGAAPVPISVSSGHFALRYEVPKFLPRGGHLCMAVLTITAVCS